MLGRDVIKAPNKYIATGFFNGVANPVVLGTTPGDKAAIITSRPLLKTILGSPLIVTLLALRFI